MARAIARRLSALERMTDEAAPDDWPPAPIPIRWYEEIDGKRHYVEPGAGEIALMDKMRRLVWGDDADSR
jgi:hypothetical protein